MLVASGSFTGNATNRSITGAGFAPDLVLVKNTATTDDTWFRIAAMAANTSMPIRSDAGGDTNQIKTLDSDGFSVGTAAAANGNTQQICWIAIKDNGGGDFGSFNFTGDDGNDKLVFSAFQPDFALVKSAYPIVGASKWTGMSSANPNTGSTNIAIPNYQGANWRTGLIYFGSDGLRVSAGDGTNLINLNAQSHYGFALKAATGVFATGSYTGDGTSSRVITVGFQPVLVFVKRYDSGEQVLAWQAQHATGNTVPFDGSQVTGKIDSVSGTGFTVSSNSNVNGNGSTYYWMATAAKASAPPLSRPPITQAIRRAATY